MWVRNRKEMTYRKRGGRRREEEEEEEEEEHRPRAGASFAFQCAASLRLLLIVQHGHCRASVYRVLPAPIRIPVGVGGDRARQPR